MVLVDLPDIQFTEEDQQIVLGEILKYVESETNRTLNRADPDRIFLLALVNIILMQKVSINQTAKSQLLRYARGPLLDHLGEPNTPRLKAKAAATTQRFNLSIPLAFDQVIPAGTRVGPDGGDGSLYFATQADAVIPSGSAFFDVSVIATTSGDIGNGFLTGQLNTLIDPLPFIQSVSNQTTTTGGADEEEDDPYRERIRLAPESYSTAGPKDAYIYWAKSANSSIVDVEVDSPEPYKVVVSPLLEGGVIPNQEVLNQVNEAVNDRSIRPLTDQVIVQAPTAVDYDITLTYYISANRAAEEDTIQAAVIAAVDLYRLWQKSKLGRALNPSELIARIMNAGALRVNVTSPVYKELTGQQVAREVNVNANYGGMAND